MNPQEVTINKRGQVVSGLKQAGGGNNGHEHRFKINVCYKQDNGL